MHYGRSKKSAYPVLTIFVHKDVVVSNFQQVESESLQYSVSNIANFMYSETAL